MKTFILCIGALATSIRDWFNPESPPPNDFDWAGRTWKPIVDSPPPPPLRAGRAAAHCMKCGTHGSIVVPTDDDGPDERDDQIDSRQCFHCNRYAMVAD